MPEILDSQFDARVVRARGAKLLWFCSPSCVPCKTLAPVLERVGAKYPDVEVLKMDISKGHEVAQRLGVMSVPTLFAAVDGRVLLTIPRVPTERELEEVFLYLSAYWES